VASEVDPGLAARAAENLAAYPNVAVHSGDGAAVDPGACDAILINAGVTHPHPLWIDRLKDGGRLILPLTVSMGKNLGKGIMARITRVNGALSAQPITFIAIYSCSSVRDPQFEPLLGKALTTGALLKLKSVRQDTHEPAATCVLHANNFCLSSAELPVAHNATST
jgi:protein-L-isoaspartate(D-aspartate) O-methyltransferase